VSLPSERSGVQEPLSGRTVIVVGGGICGPAAALLLARAGAEVTVLERIRDFSRAGGGYVLAANGLAVLYGLGLREILQAKGRVVRATWTRLEGGRLLAHHAMPDWGPDLDHGLGVARFELCNAFLDAMDAEPRITVRLGAHVEGASPDGTVRFTTADGPATELRADLVIGADGVKSAVRSSGADRFGGSLQRTGLAVARIMAELRPDEVEPIEGYGETWTRFGTTIGGAAGVAGRTYMSLAAGSWRVRRALARRDLAALSRLWSRVLPAAGRAIERLSSFDDLLVNPIDKVTCRTWVDGRVVLLGDAAHAMSPHVGQGANSSLLDAAVLVDELGRAARQGESQDVALTRYEARRKPEATRVQRISWREAILSERLIAPGVRHLRNVVMLLVARRRGGGFSPADMRARSIAQEDPAEIYAVVSQIMGRRSAA
jgi:2-polyprenyl-6-methoxyphenol hydroxylase-like FAD-dependent oxidoreductase